MEANPEPEPPAPRQIDIVQDRSTKHETESIIKIRMAAKPTRRGSAKNKSGKDHVKESESVQYHIQRKRAGRRRREVYVTWLK